MLKREAIGYVLIDEETLARRPYLRRLGKPGADAELGWRTVFTYFNADGSFILYEVGESSLGHDEAKERI